MLFTNGFLKSANPILVLQRDYENNANKLSETLNKTTNNSEKLKIYNLFGVYYESTSNYTAAFAYLKKADSLHTLINDVEQQIISYNYKGYIYWHQSLYDSSLKYHQKAQSLAVSNKLENSSVAFTQLMLGEDYYDLGDYVKTSEYYYNSLSIFEKLQDTLGQIQAHNRLSKLYYRLKDYKTSKKHISVAQRLNKNIKNNREIAVSFNSIGNIQIEIGSLNSALHFFTKTLEYFTKCDDLIGQSISCINLGDVYNSLYKSKSTGLAFLDSSYKYYNKSYNLNSLVDNKFGIIYGLWGMADVALKKGSSKEAINNYHLALTVAKQINASGEEYQLYWKIHQLFDALNQNDSSYLYLKKYVNLKNSRESEEQTKALLRQESKYEIEKRLAEEAVKREKERIIEEEKNRWKNYVIAAVACIAIILIYLVVSSVKRLKIIASKNELINTINSELIIQKKEITDSITYAKRIQEAILPSDSYFKECGIDAFVYYKPKDIVA
ncbi:MAG: tetratricopeptide repeat protein, partial [Bacteroidia bacterium]|nr:tetratricopeptide repeat protein [Bacteroidia bacterium]